MTQINDIADLVRVLQEQPQWAETLRGVLLSRELLELPEEFAKFVKLTQDNFELVNTRLERLESDVAQLKTDVAQLKTDVVQLKEGQAELTASVAGIRRDLAPIKGAHARNGALRSTRRIARTVNCRQQEILDQDILSDMVEAGDTSGILPGEIRSFENADIVILAADRDNGEARYLAVEASFTANLDDVRRAVRNAGYLTRFTGHSATAMVASVNVNPGIQPDIDSGRVVWYEIESRHLEPD